MSTQLISSINITSFPQLPTMPIRKGHGIKFSCNSRISSQTAIFTSEKLLYSYALITTRMRWVGQLVTVRYVGTCARLQLSQSSSRSDQQRFFKESPGVEVPGIMQDSPYPFFAVSECLKTCPNFIWEKTNFIWKIGQIQWRMIDLNHTKMNSREIYLISVR